MNWYYIDGPLRVGPLNETEWAELVLTGKIQPETLVWHVGVEKWTAYRLMAPPEVPETEPELPDFDAVPETAKEESPEAFAARVVDRDFPVNLDRCISNAWSIFKSNFWELVGATFLVLAVIWTGLKLPVLEFVVPLLLQGVIMGGLYNLYLLRMRGEPATFSDLFAGFGLPLLKPLALTTLVSFLVMLACFSPVPFAVGMIGILPPNMQTMMAENPQQALTVMQDALAADPQKAEVLLLVILACSIPAAYFGFCWMFALPLVVDKRMAFWPAMKLSRAKVLQHPWKIGILSVVAGMIGFAGVLGFGLAWFLAFGVFFTLPLYFLIKLSLYKDMFNTPPTSHSADPDKE